MNGRPRVASTGPVGGLGAVVVAASADHSKSPHNHAGGCNLILRDAAEARLAAACAFGSSKGVVCQIGYSRMHACEFCHGLGNLYR